jgi:glutamyl-tRNA reductase
VTTGPADGGPFFLVAGTNHKHAALPERERWVHERAVEKIAPLLARETGLNEHLLLSTCNRLEVWGLSTAPPPRALGSKLDALLGAREGTTIVAVDQGACLHAVRVAAGLDSMQWGEPQIARQLREAMRVAVRGGTAGSHLRSIVTDTLNASAAIRSAADLSDSSDGAGHVAAKLIQRRCAAGRQRVLILGAGQTGAAVAKAAVPFAHVTVATPTPGKAESLARRLGVTAISYFDALSGLRSFDVVVGALSVEAPIIGAPMLEEPPDGHVSRKLVLDLSVPRCVDPRVATLPHVQLLNLDQALDAFQQPPDVERAGHAEEAARAAARSMAHRLRSRAVEPTVAALRQRAAAIGVEEAESALQRLPHVTAAQRAVVEKLAERIVNRLLHAPTEALRESAAAGDPSLEEAARRFFQLEPPR